jgi:YD repeat-containing protein
MPAKFANNATATLAASLSTSSTSITVTTGQGALFPTLGASEYFYATLTNSSNNIEIVKITARASDTLTAVRAQEGTTALTWNAADKLELRITSAVLTNFAQQDSPNTFAGAMTYGGVTLANAVTGTGNMVLSASPALTGTPTAPTAASGTNTTQVATTAFANAAFQGAYPVGSIYMNASSGTNPATLLGFGTWVAFGAGRVPIGFDSGNALFSTVGNTGGSADAITVSHTHTATVTDPTHTHLWGNPPSPPAPQGGGSYNAFSSGGSTYSSTSAASTGISVANSTTGSSGTNANYQPYITVYMWQRTA